jgi:tetratricopeptide (TPR) repeat protein
MMSVRRFSAALVFLLATAPLGAQVTLKESLSPREARKRDAIEHYLKAKYLSQDSEFEDALKEFRKAVDLDPDDANLRREYAELLRDLPIYPEAEKQARKAVELSPGNAGAQRILGQVLLATAKDRKDVEEAAAALKKANDANPNEPSGAVAYAQALLRLDKPQDAATALERVLDKGRGSAIALLYGDALEKSGQFAQAEDLYRSIARQEPENRAASLGLLRVYERSRQYDKAATLLESFLKTQPGNLGLKTQYAALLLRARRFADARRTLDEVLKADPGNRDALRLTASLLSETREVDKADEILKKLQTMEPDDPDIQFRRAMNFLEARRLPEAEKILVDLRAQLVAKKKADAELPQVDGQLAYIAYLKKDYASAAARLTGHLFDEDGLNQQAFNLLLQIARDKEDWAEGLRVAQEAWEKSKRTPLVRSSYAEFLIRSSSAKDQAEGKVMLDALAAEDKPGALAVADAWQRLDKYDRAAATARKALETWNEDPDLLFRLAASLEREKKIQESVAAFEQLIAVRADHAPGLNYLGYLWADRGENLNKALELIRRAVELDPSNGAYLDSLGWVYFQMNKLDKAEGYLKAASALNPDDPTVTEHLGDLLEKQGDVQQARELWKRALTLKPDDGGKKLEEKLKRTENRVDTTRK